MNPIVSHKKSNTVVNGQPLLPTPEEIRVGEITVNYAAGHETLAIKNDEDEIVSFKPVDITEIEKDETVIAYAISSLHIKDNELLKKLSKETSRATSAETDIIEQMQDTVKELEKDLTVIAHAISTLDKRILQMETYFTSMTTPTTSETGYTSAVFEFTE